MQQIKTTVLLVLIITFSGFAQQQVRKAKIKYEDYAFVDAIEAYEYLHGKGHSDREVFQKLGDANYLNANYEKAKDWYAKLMGISGMDTVNTYVFRYAQALRSTGDYEVADQWMQKLDNGFQEDLRFTNFNTQKNYLETIKENSGRYEISPLSINSDMSEFAPSIYKDQLVFSSSRKRGFLRKVSHDWNKQPFLDLYQIPLGMDSLPNVKVGKIAKGINKKTHESSTAFTKDGNTVYFTRNNSKTGKKFSRDENGVSRLKIFKATLEEDVWKNVTELPFNDDGYSVAHPALGPNEKKLYFSSDMPGTYGESDIFVVDILEDGTYGAPQNLGPKINTESRETFPHIATDNTLYFSSDGHPGLGGLDVFSVALDEEATVVNMGEPINSTKDDFSLIFDQSGENGYLASNREGSLGYDDLYAFTYKGKQPKIEEKIEEVPEQKEEIVETVVEIPEEEPLADLAAMNLDLVYFDFDATSIKKEFQDNLDQVAELLKQHEDWKLNITTHTDSRGNATYNQGLSERRLKAAKDYLIRKGVDKAQLVGSALGETQMVNDCDEAMNCGRQQHALNRRAELLLIR